MDVKELAAACLAIATRADELAKSNPIVSGEAVARLVRCLATDENARITFNTLVMLSRADIEAAS